MTPEEQAVIDAAIAWYHTETIGEAEDQSERLQDAVNALEASRVPQLRWYPATWADVRAGDRIRLPVAPDHEAVVESAVQHMWHIDPRSDRYTVIHNDHEVMGVRLVGRDDFLTFLPADAVEIQLSERVYAGMMLLGGWDNRIS